MISGLIPFIVSRINYLNNRFVQEINLQENKLEVSLTRIKGTNEVI